MGKRTGFRDKGHGVTSKFTKARTDGHLAPKRQGYTDYGDGDKPSQKGD